MHNLLTTVLFDEHIDFKSHFICDEQINGLKSCNRIILLKS